MTDQVTEKRQDATDPPWMERSFAGLLRLLGGTVMTFLDLLIRPWRSPVHAADSAPAAPPISFLVVGLLFSGVAARAFVLYLTREVDMGVTSVVSDAIDQWGPKEVLLVTLPIVTLIVMAGLGTARWTLWGVPAFQNPIIRGVCYASGFQVLGLGLFATGIIASKFFRGHDRVANRFLEDGPLLLLVGFLVISGAFQIERALKRFGQGPLARIGFLRGSLALTTSGTVFVGVIATGILSFDLMSVVEQGQQEYLQSEFASIGEAGVHASAITTKYSETPDKLLRIEQTFLLTNYSKDRWAVPRPDSLDPIIRDGGKPSIAEPLIVETCSIDFTNDAGWILGPGESRIVKWSVLIPESVRDERQVALAQFTAVDADVEDYFALNPDSGSGTRPIWVLLDWTEAPTEVARRQQRETIVPVSASSIAPIE